MAKLFAVRLQILETKIKDIHSTQSLANDTENINERLNTLEKKINELATRITQTESKITQIINEITPIITSHANALNALLGNSLHTNTK